MFGHACKTGNWFASYQLAIFTVLCWYLDFFCIILGKPHKGIGLLFIFTIILLSLFTVFFIFTTSTIISIAIAVIWNSAFNSRSSHLLDSFHGSTGFGTLTTVINSQLVRYVRFEVEILCLQSCLLIPWKSHCRRRWQLTFPFRKAQEMESYGKICTFSSDRLNKLYRAFPRRCNSPGRWNDTCIKSDMKEQSTGSVLLVS